MLMHLPKAWHRGQVRFMKPLGNRPRIASRRPNIRNPMPGDDDLLILPPTPRMHIKQPSDPQCPICRTLAERHQHQVLADPGFAFGGDQPVIRNAKILRHRAPSRQCEAGCIVVPKNHLAHREYIATLGRHSLDKTIQLDFSPPQPAGAAKRQPDADLFCPTPGKKPPAQLLSSQRVRRADMRSNESAYCVIGTN